MIFERYLIQEKEVTDEKLREWLNERVKKAERYDTGFGEMVKIMSDQVIRGGKRVRPLLVRLGYQMGGLSVNEEVIKASLFPELIHQNLLVHDDIVDRDVRRYGQKNLEVVYSLGYSGVKVKKNEEKGHFGRSMAMLAGDHLRTLAYQVFHETEFEAWKKTEVLTYFEEVLEATLAGWQIQYLLNYRPIDLADEERFLKGLELVTARYSFEAPLMIGAILAGQRQKNEQQIKKYASCVGVSFQLIDDVLGVFGDGKKTGKGVGNDIREGKKTKLVLDTFRTASKTERKFLSKMVGTDVNTQQLDKLRELITSTGALESSLRLARQNADLAIKTAKTLITENNDVVTRLQQLADFVVRREY